MAASLTLLEKDFFCDLLRLTSITMAPTATRLRQAKESSKGLREGSELYTLVVVGCHQNHARFKGFNRCEEECSLSHTCVCMSG
jgi:hypothetical protein